LGEEDNAPFSKDQIIEFVYEQQIPDGGFRGGPFMSFHYEPGEAMNSNDIPHLANTYCALCLLILCGDYKFKKLNRPGLISKLKSF
jgi:prenyltransferase beta subunit